MSYTEYQSNSPYAASSTASPYLQGGSSAVDQALAYAPANLIPGSSAAQQQGDAANVGPQGLPPQGNGQQVAAQQAAPADGQQPQAAAGADQPSAEDQAAADKGDKGFWGNLWGGVTSFVKGATVGLVKSVVESFKDPKTWIMTAIGIASMFIPVVGPIIGTALLAYGATTALSGVVTNGAKAAELYSQGEVTLAEQALEDTGTSVGALGLTALGARGMIKAGQLPTSFTKNGIKGTFTDQAKQAGATTTESTAAKQSVAAVRERNNVFTQSLSDLNYVQKYGMHQISNGARAVFTKSGRQEAVATGKQVWQTYKDAAASEGGWGRGILKVSKDTWKENAAAAASFSESQRLSGQRNLGSVDGNGAQGVTGLGNKNIATTVSDTELLGAVKASGKFKQAKAEARTFTSQEGKQVTYDIGTIQSNLRDRGYVNVKNADGIWTWMKRDEARSLGESLRTNATSLETVTANSIGTRRADVDTQLSSHPYASSSKNARKTEINGVGLSAAETRLKNAENEVTRTGKAHSADPNNATLKQQYDDAVTERNNAMADGQAKANQKAAIEDRHAREKAEYESLQ